jgi:hypothetical protein
MVSLTETSKHCRLERLKDIGVVLNITAFICKVEDKIKGIVRLYQFMHRNNGGTVLCFCVSAAFKFPFSTTIALEVKFVHFIVISNLCVLYVDLFFPIML